MKKIILNVLSLGFAVVMLAGCGSKDNCQTGYTSVNGQCVLSNGLGAGYAGGGMYPGTGYGTCQAGYLQTQYGCLPQGNCGAGQALYNGTQCIAVTGTSGYPGTGGYPGGSGMCGMGMVQTMYGCLQQGPCMPGYGLYGPYCVRGY